MLKTDVYALALALATANHHPDCVGYAYAVAEAFEPEPVAAEVVPDIPPA